MGSDSIFFYGPDDAEWSHDRRSMGKWSLTPFLPFLVVALAVTGCVTKETYSAQVIRTNNFQRQLAEEEKRSADLTAEIARLKNQVLDLEAQNRTLTAQLKEAKAQVVRSLEEVGRLQKEIKQARAASVAPSGAAAPQPKARGVPPSSTEPPDRLDELKDDAAPNAKSPP
jgi:septal ring factor EnvC (AmiA/AmiB activator)